MSARCREAAEGVIQVARTQDPRARFWLLRPSPDCGPAAMIKQGQIRILPSIQNPPRWTHHVCVETERHCVCALAGAGGAPRESYVATHFQYPNDVEVRKIKNESVLAAKLRVGP